MKGPLDHQDHQVPKEIWESLGVLGSQGHVVSQEPWGTWACQVLKEKGGLLDSQVWLEHQACQVLAVFKEIRESQVMQKGQGQDHQDQRGIQDCQEMWERKEKEGHLAHPDIQGLLDLQESPGVPEALAFQECRVLMVRWGLKESKASLDTQE